MRKEGKTKKDAEQVKRLQTEIRRLEANPENWLRDQLLRESKKSRLSTGNRVPAAIMKKILLYKSEMLAILYVCSG